MECAHIFLAGLIKSEFNAKTPSRKDFGLRWQSEAATALSQCDWCSMGRKRPAKSGVALRFPPQSKKVWLRLCVFALKIFCMDTFQCR
jgi:hypothetical protein